MKKKKDFRTRKAILDILKQEGPQDSKTLAARLGITAMGIRQHLYALRDEHLLSYREESRPMGRPAKMWELTREANQFFPDGSSELLADMLGHISKVYGSDALPKLIESRAQSQFANYYQQLQGCETLLQKIQRLAQIRTEEGYIAEVQETPEGNYLLIENHCPICAAAQTCQNFCSAELHLFQQVLGPQANVRRMEHIVSGSRRCVYEVKTSLGANDTK